jgi:two-component system sensor histidine kinase SenX3|tara:strand:- start:359 stop:1516 length:1158 start_codon:yes stop_codon:yes gene_type:complete
VIISLALLALGLLVGLAVLITKIQAKKVSVTQENVKLQLDIDDLTQQIDAAHLSFRRGQAALDSLAIGVVTTDERGSVCLTNDIGQTYLEGRRADALVAKALSEALSIANNGVEAKKTVTLTGPPSKVIEVKAIPISEPALSIGAVALIEDQTAAARIDRVRRDFIANLTHELRTPIAAIGLLAETLRGEEEQVVLDSLTQKIVNETDRVDKIIDDLLELSRVELDGSPRRELVDVRLLLGSVEDQYRFKANSKNIQIEKTDTEAGLKLMGDAGQLNRALSNLVDNSIKYSDENSIIHLIAVRGPTYIDLVVRDQGIGIPKADLDRIFERFYRVDKARSRATGGTGLGLSIVRHVAVNHGGEILLRSREGEGSQFTIRLPEDLEK